MLSLKLILVAPAQPCGPLERKGVPAAWQHISHHLYNYDCTNVGITDMNFHRFSHGVRMMAAHDSKEGWSRGTYGPEAPLRLSWH